MMHHDTFERDGLRFRAYIEPDDCSDPPWVREDGHGPVRAVHGWSPQKRPGERVLHKDRGTTWLYDWQAACRMARKDGWNVAPFSAPHRIERAVQADFDRLCDWLCDTWSYVGVCVCAVDAEDSDIGSRFQHSLWGIESDAGEYLREVADELADEILAQRKAAWRSALRAARARRAMERAERLLASST